MTIQDLHLLYMVSAQHILINNMLCISLYVQQIHPINVNYVAAYFRIFVFFRGSPKTLGKMED